MQPILPCAGCGTAVAAANVLYTQDAMPVCARCYASADIVETDKRHANAIRTSAIGAGIGGMISFLSPASGMLLVVIVACTLTMMSGIYAMRAVTGDHPRFTRHLTAGDRTLIWVCSIFGVGIAGLSFVATMTGLHPL